MIFAGMKLTCPNGHEIATVAVTMKSGDRISVDSFVDWKIDKPKAGTKIAPCPICGTRYIGSSASRYMLKGHFKDKGWLP